MLGTGSVTGVGQGRVVYLMRVSEILSIEDYDADKRFKLKIPVFSGESWKRRGDNIYFKNGNGQWQQRRSFHSARNMDHDLSGINVLIGGYFFYFGSEAPKLKGELIELRKLGPGHKIIDDEKKIKRLEEWVATKGKPGINGEPFNSTFMAEEDVGCMRRKPCQSKSACGG